MRDARFLLQEDESGAPGCGGGMQSPVCMISLIPHLPVPVCADRVCEFLKVWPPNTHDKIKQVFSFYVSHIDKWWNYPLGKKLGPSHLSENVLHLIPYLWYCLKEHKTSMNSWGNWEILNKRRNSVPLQKSFQPQLAGKSCGMCSQALSLTWLCKGDDSNSVALLSLTFVLFNFM